MQLPSHPSASTHLIFGVENLSQEQMLRPMIWEPRMIQENA